MHCKAPGSFRLALAIGLALAAGGVLAQSRTAPGATAATALPAPAEGGQSDPRRAATVAEQVRRLIGEKKPDDALKLLEAGLRDHPADAQLRFLYGVMQADRGRTRDAIDVFTQLAADFPELPEPHNNLAVLHAAAGDLDRARAALEEAVRAAPAYALAQENLGDLHLRLAARAYERALQADARSASARAKLDMARDLIARIATPASGGSGPRKTP